MGWYVQVVNSRSGPVYANGIEVGPGGRYRSEWGASVRVPSLGLVEVMSIADWPPAGGPRPSTGKAVCGSVQRTFPIRQSDDTDPRPQATDTVLLINADGSFSVDGDATRDPIRPRCPDAVFPVPALYGEPDADGINLFTGDVNLRVELAGLADGPLSWSLAALYNSRGAAFDPGDQGSSLGGRGWKLLDYPKIVRDGAGLFLLDGVTSYHLEATGQSSSYRADRQYCTWSVEASADGSSWAVTDDNGRRYALDRRDDTAGPGRSIWSLTSCIDLCWPAHRIDFSYQGNRLSSVANSLGERLSLSYDTSDRPRLASIERTATPGGGPPSTLEQVLLWYGETSGPGLLTLALSVVPLLGGRYAPVDGGWRFGYLPADSPVNPHALSTVQEPLGGLTEYQYYGGRRLQRAGSPVPGLHPVVGVRRHSGERDVVCRGIWYGFDSWTFDETQTVAQFDLVRDYPGGSAPDDDTGAPQDPFGHTTHRFFNGQPTELVRGGSRDDREWPTGALGLRCSRTDVGTVRTETVPVVSGTDTVVPPWPGVLLPIPAGASRITSLAARCTNRAGASGEVRVALEDGGLGLGVLRLLGFDAGRTVSDSVAVQLLVPATGVRVYSTAAQGTVLHDLTLTRAVPMSATDPGVVPQPYRAALTAVLFDGPGSQPPGSRGRAAFSVAGYPPLTAVHASVRSDVPVGKECHLFCYDAQGEEIAHVVDGCPPNGRVVLTVDPPSTVVTVVVTGLVSVERVTLEYERSGVTLTDDAHAQPKSATTWTWQVGTMRPWWAALQESRTSVDGMEHATTYTWGDPLFSSLGPVSLLASARTTAAKPDQTASGAATAVTTTTSFTYAFEHYPALRERNVLSPVAQVVESATGTGGAAPVLVRGATTQWQDFGQGAWAPARQYELVSATAGDGFAATPDPGWRAAAAVNRRNPRGRVTSQMEADGTTTSQIWDAASGTLPVATFAGADAGAGQAGYLGFEPYEDTRGWTLSGGSFSDGSHTGTRCYAGTDLVVTASAFTPRMDGASPADQLIGCYVKLNKGGLVTVGFKDPGSGQWHNSIRRGWFLDRDGRPPGWTYLELYATSGRALPTVEVSDGAIDHVHHAPVDASFTATVWQLPHRRPTAGIGPGGEVSRLHHDATGRVVASAGPGRQVSVAHHAYTSPVGAETFTGRPTFSDAMPNMALDVRAAGPSLWASFSTADVPAFPAEQRTMVIDQAHGLLLAAPDTTSERPSTAVLSLPPGVEVDADFAVLAEVIPGPLPVNHRSSIGFTLPQRAASPDGGPPGQWSELTFEMRRDDYGLLYTDATHGKGWSLAGTTFDQPPTVVVLTLVRTGRTLRCYADGRLVGEHRLTDREDHLTGPITIRTSWPGSAVHHVGFLARPELSLQLRDGHGFATQFQAASGPDSTTVTQDLYTGAGRLYAGTTLPTTVDGAAPAPQAGFAALDEAQMTVSGSITGQWPPDMAASPLEVTVRRDCDPLLRVSALGAGGGYAAGAACSAGFRYGNGSAQDMTGYFGFPSGLLHPTSTHTPSGLCTGIYRNHLGMVFGQARMDLTGGLPPQLTGCEYDAALRLVARYHPNAFAEPHIRTPGVFEEHYGYDFLGNPTSVASSDAGIARYRYDSADRVRLRVRQATDGSTEETPVYRRYDPAGRLVEEGTLTTAFASAGDAELDDPSWPAGNAGAAWRRQFLWDRGPHALGRLVYADTRDTVHYSYTYDERGRIEGVKIGRGATMGSDIGTYAYTHDEVGRVTAITGPAGYAVTYAYDDLGRVVSIGMPGDPAHHASYTYTNGQIVERLADQTITRIYTLGPLGSCRVIEDDYLREELFYGTRHSGAPGVVDSKVASAVYSCKSGPRWPAPPPGRAYEYDYDVFGRLTAARATAATGAAEPQHSVTGVGYDGNGNITAMTVGSTTRTFAYRGGCNQLLGDGGAGQDVTYDLAGRLLTCARLGLTIGYDPVTGAPASAARVDPATGRTTTVRFGYDAYGRCVQHTVEDGSGTTTTTSLRDATGRALVERVTTATGTRTVGHVFGPTGRLALVELDDSQRPRYLLKDHLGSTRVVVGSDGAVTGWYDYTPFGELLADVSSPDPLCRHLFTGQEWDDVLGLYRFPARLYDPWNARFHAPDPEHQFASPYTYAPDPVSMQDPSGAWFGWDDVIAIGVGAVFGFGLELARQAIAGESLDFGQAGIAAGIGAAMGEAALYTGGGSVLAGAAQPATSAALRAAGSLAARSMLTGAAISGGIGGAVGLGSGISQGHTGAQLAEDFGRALGVGAVTGAQAGMVGGVVGRAAAARAMGVAVRGSAVSSEVQLGVRTWWVGSAAGGASSFVSSVATSAITDPASFTSNRWWQDALQAGASGALSGGAYRLRQGMAQRLGFAPQDARIGPARTQGFPAWPGLLPRAARAASRTGRGALPMAPMPPQV